MSDQPHRLLAVPNFMVGSDERVVGALEATLGAECKILDTHMDARHGRTVITVLADGGDLLTSLPAAAAQAAHLIDITRGDGLHPHIGATDVCPVVYPNDGLRDLAHTVARQVAEKIGEAGIPVFLYGELATDPKRVERSYFRSGGLEELTARIEGGEMEPDFGPPSLHPTAGATLVTARPPLVAFNLELDTPDLEAARAVAAELRESGGGPVGVRAIALPWTEGRTQISVNIGDPVAVPLREVISRTRRLAGSHGAKVVAVELVGLTPHAALEAYPDDLPIEGFDPDRKVIERLLV